MAPKTPKPTDRRVLRTRRTLRDALISLILERSWDDITVQDVCARADVGRSTFYTHFADKEELLVSGFDDLREALRLPPPHNRSEHPRVGRFALPVLEHAHSQQRLFRALIGKRSGIAVQKQFRNMLIDVVREEFAATPGGLPPDPVVHFVVGAFIELLMWWLDARAPIEPGALADIFKKMTNAAVPAARH